MARRKLDLLIAPVGEGLLLLVMAALAWAIRQPLLFASLGPTIYELIEQPNAKSARTYNVIAGHFLGMGSGFFALWLLHAWNSPKVPVAGLVVAPRMWAAVIAVTLTTLVTLAVRASQPASLATALLIALGSMQTARDAAAIATGVLIIAAIGEPLRRVRARLAREKPSLAPTTAGP